MSTFSRRLASLALATIIATITISVSHAQSTLTPEQYISQLEQVYKNAANISKEPNSISSEIMAKNLTKEQLAEWEKEEALIEAETNQAIAECAGISTQQLIDLQKADHSSTVIKSLKQCKSKLPESINTSDTDYFTSPNLKNFKECAIDAQSKIIGFDMTKLEQCNQEIDDNF